MYYVPIIGEQIKLGVKVPWDTKILCPMYLLFDDKINLV